MVVVNMFWYGPKLGAIHAACVRSFVRHGHRTILHCYSKPVDAPDGVEVFDARALMPEIELIRDNATGSPAIGADRYRYRLIESGMGLYCDCDVFCMKPIDDEDYIFSREQDNYVNNAVLKYPPNSELSRALVAATKSRYYVPEWLRRRDRFAFALRKKLGFPISVEDMHWGVWGPTLLTHHVKTLGLWHRSKPMDYFYPVHPRHTELFFDPDLRLDDLVTHRTLGIHLWHSMLKGKEPPKGSPLYAIINDMV